MRIVIDLQGAQNGSRFRGIGRYTTAFVKQLIVEANGHEVIIALNGAFADTLLPIREEFSAILPQSQIVVWHPMVPAAFLDKKNDHRRKFSEAVREAFLSTLRPDVVLVSTMFEGAGDDVVTSIGTFVSDLPTAVILYDFIPLIYPDDYLADTQVRSWYMTKFGHMRRAQLLLAISESSRQEGIRYLGFDDTLVTNISTAIDPAFSRLAGTSASVLAKKFSINRPFVMYSGASDYRKNLFRLIRAYAKLPANTRRNHQLLLAGGMPQDHVKALNTEAVNVGLEDGEVIFTGYISDDEMVGLYRAAKGFVFPSYHEGFGLPVLEAMSLGTPVIGSNTSSIPEVLENPEALFDPWSVDAISSKLQKLLSDDGFRQRLIKHGNLQCKKFSWEATARCALAALVDNFGGSRSGKAKFGFFPPSAQVDALIGVSAGLVESASEVQLLKMSELIDYAVTRDKSVRSLFVDVSELQRYDSKTGIQRVVRNVLNQLLSAPPPGYEVVPVYATPTQSYRVANRFVRKFWDAPDTDEPDHALDFRVGDLFLGLDYQDELITAHASFFASLRGVGVSVFFVVYDILAQKLDNIFSSDVTVNQVAWLKTVAMSDGLVCISRAVADDVYDWLKMFGPKRQGKVNIGWFHLGGELESTHAADKPDAAEESMLRQIQSKPAFLVVSTIEPRKRQPQVLDAFEVLWKKGQDVRLVLVGKCGWDMDDFIARLHAHPEFNKRLFWLPGISDRYLDRVYAACRCIIAASLGEGFGLSLIEGARHGLPAIARDIPVFREVAQDQARFFSGEDGESLAQSVFEWLSEYRSGASLRQIRPKWLSWKESTAQLCQVVLGANWYREWTPDDKVRFSMTDPAMSTQVGRRSASGLSTTRSMGYLVHGPYIPLGAGRQEVLIYGQIRSATIGSWKADVAVNQGRTVLATFSGGSANTRDVVARLAVDVPPDCQDFEVRVHVDGNVDLTITRLEILQAQTEETPRLTVEATS
jgi:glycosyltransferase involved in cell wall biosynthesis